ncbi:hypothetical protein KSP39_PZI007614 [Platanthera zijinensis]|uniref:Uncharacterized protein n=1 Tax=Platanthera zijinensis TaxID=2320716 RepID=A0AAP0BPV5_9ASPA
MSNSDEGEEFYESLDRVLSSSCSSTSASDDDDDCIYSEHHFRYSHCSPPSADSSDVWLSEPGSVEERRRHLLHQMGLARDPSLAQEKPYRDEASYDGLRPRSNLTRVTSITGAFSRSRSDGSVEPRVLRRQQASVSGKPPLIGRSRPSLGGEVELEVLEGDDRRNWEDAKMCTIKDLGNGAEFVVKEFGEDGMWKNLRDVGSGRQLSMEEFDLCVGSSPAVQELMRRPDVEESGNGSGVSSDRSKDGGESYGGGMSKRRSSWLKSLKNVVSAGHWQDWRSSEEKDTSSEKGERRSSSATDDSQEAQDAVQSILHGPELVKVRQYGKSHKELTGLFLSQEIQAHNGSIWTIKFSLDSRYLASAGEDFVVHVWQVYEKDMTPDILVDRAGEEDDNGNILPEEMLLISGMEGSHWEKKKGSNGSNGRKSVSLDHVMVPEQLFTISERPIYSFTGHLDDVLDLSWSKSQQLRRMGRACWENKARLNLLLSYKTFKIEIIAIKENVEDMEFGVPVRRRTEEEHWLVKLNREPSGRQMRGPKWTRPTASSVL